MFILIVTKYSLWHNSDEIPSSEIWTPSSDIGLSCKLFFCHGTVGLSKLYLTVVFINSVQRVKHKLGNQIWNQLCSKQALTSLIIDWTYLVKQHLLTEETEDILTEIEVLSHCVTICMPDGNRYKYETDTETQCYTKSTII